MLIWGPVKAKEVKLTNNVFAANQISIKCSQFFGHVNDNSDEDKI